MYADDTTLVFTLENCGALNNIAVIEDEINREITIISHWLHSNMLLLNTTKSKFMVFVKWNMVFKCSYLHIIQSLFLLLIYNNVQYVLNYVKFLIYQNKFKN